jgi:orotate phosphoribosyltransferase
MNIDMDIIAKKIIDSKSIVIRDINNDDEPFVYSSGNRGPGYIMIKGLVGQRSILKYLVKKLALKIYQQLPNPPDFISGNVTGGVIIGWILCNKLSKLYNKDIPYCYLRVSRKMGGHYELITGNLNNPLIKPGMEVLIVEELINYGQTTINATKIYRESGYKVNYGVSILSYDNPQTNIYTKLNNIKLISLITLPQLLEFAEKQELLDSKLIHQYQLFLANPIMWQIKNNLLLPEDSAIIAKSKGINMIKLESNKAILAGAPKDKVLNNIPYYTTDYNITHSCPKIWIALDFNTIDEILMFAQNICSYFDDKLNYSFGFKINLDIIIKYGIYHKWIQKLQSFYRPIFVDLKMWNGNRTMISIINQLDDIGIDFVNIYSHAGPKFINNVVNNAKHVKILVLTVLTHYNDDYTFNIYNSNIKDSIIKLLNNINNIPYYGIILPAQYSSLFNNDIKNKNKYIISPGIRIDTNNTSNYQHSICTPQKAFEYGCDSIVLGTVITKSNNSGKMLKNIFENITN